MYDLNDIERYFHRLNDQLGDIIRSGIIPVKPTGESWDANDFKAHFKKDYCIPLLDSYNFPGDLRMPLVSFYLKSKDWDRIYFEMQTFF